jgi:hypothetical protein
VQTYRAAYAAYVSPPTYVSPEGTPAYVSRQEADPAMTVSLTISGKDVSQLRQTLMMFGFRPEDVQVDPADRPVLRVVNDE